jgi:uroporphyrinogen decarboxylase
MVRLIEKPSPWRPDFRQLAMVLEGKRPDRPVLFELFLNDDLIADLAGERFHPTDALARDLALIKANERLGYDYAIVLGSGFDFPSGRREKAQSVSLNAGAVITSRSDFDKYLWPDPDAYSYERLDVLSQRLPDGMKLMVWSPDGMLETVIKLVGYENLCYLLYDEPELVSDIFEQVGHRFLRYFARCLNCPAVAGVVSSDDWGFGQQTLLPPDALRKLLFPWQRELVQMAHRSGRYAILHSCGEFQSILPDILSIGFDARHSYEDKILPVERAYPLMKGKIAVLGGLDLDFLCRRSSDSIYRRAAALLEATFCEGYALGTGNSVPDYLPRESYFAMLRAAYDW